MLQREDYVDLAWGLLHDRLSPSERRLALEMIASDAEFLEVLKLELTLKNELAQLKQPLPEPVKKRVQAMIKGSQKKALYAEVAHTVLEVFMPKVTLPVLNIFERSVFQ